MSNISGLRSTLNPQAKVKKGVNTWMVVSILLLLVLVAVLAQAQVGDDEKNKMTVITADEAGSKLVNFINKNFPAVGGNASLNSVEEQNGLYKVSIKTAVNGQERDDDLYISKDGKLFLPSAQDMAELEQQIADANQNNPQADASQQAEEIPKSEKPKVELFTMSYCPFGNQAEDGMSPVARLLGDKIDLEPHYVIYSNYRGGGPQYCLDKENKYCSMHGIDELNQNIRELCIYKYNQNKFWDYIDKVNKECDLQNIEECWENPANDLGINISQIANCQKTEAETFLAKEVELNQKYGIQGSPTTVINGIRYKGGRSPEDYKQGICNAFAAQPSECEKVLGTTTNAAAGGCDG